jgi:YqxM protein
MRITRLRRFRKKNAKLFLAIQIICIWYCTLFTANYLTSTTGAYFNDIKVIGNSFQVSPDEEKTEWDKSSLEFVESGKNFKGESNVGFNCIDGFYSLLKNGGDRDMKGPSTFVLYYTEKGSPNKNDLGIEIGRGSIPALKSGESVKLSFLTASMPAKGTYKFMAFQRPGHPGIGELWGAEFNLNDNQIKACQWKSDTEEKMGVESKPTDDIDPIEINSLDSVESTIPSDESIESTNPSIEETAIDNIEENTNASNEEIIKDKPENTESEIGITHHK